MILTAVVLRSAMRIEHLPSEASVNAVLATQARERTTLELFAGLFVGATNAALIWMRFPSLHFLAAGFAARTGYALWGLADRKLDALLASPTSTRHSRILMRGVRAVAGAS